jgi:hypothetical protein
MTCEEAARLIHARLDGELADDDARALAGHVAGCPRCAQLEQSLHRLDGDLRACLTALEPPTALPARIKQEASQARPLRRSPWRWAGWAAAAVIAGAALWAVIPRSPRPLVEVTHCGHPLHVFADGATVSRTVQAGQPLRERDVIWGADDSWISLRFRDGARLDLSEDAVVQIEGNSVTICKGSVRADLRECDEPFAVVSPWGRIEGTGARLSLAMAPDDGSARISVTEGSARIISDRGETVLGKGDSVRLPSPEHQTTVL